MFYFDAGGGHASAARALGQVLERAQPAAAIERVNLQELLDPIDPIQRLFGIRLQDYYNLLIAREWTLGLTWAARALRATIRIRRRAIYRALSARFERTQPDLVVSLIPHFNPILAAALAETRPAARFALVLTDLADPTPSFWLQGLAPGEDGSPHLVVCGSERAVNQARKRGIPGSRILATSGMILRPAFYESPPLPEAQRAAGREQLRLSPTLPTALILAGGAGAQSMLEIAEQLEAVAKPMQAIFLCGRNPALAAALRARRGRHPRHVEEFTEQVPQFMRLADFFIGKPGPGSLSEAIQMGLPAIVVSNRWTLPQERYNAQWLEERQLGMALPSWRPLAYTVGKWLEASRLEAYRERASRQSNRAVFEIADALRLLARLAGDGHANARKATNSMH